jgi:outer membrane protein
MKTGIIGITLLTAMACQQQKIGYVDNVELMDKYQEKIAIEEKYKTQSEAFGRKRDSISQEFQKEAQELQQQAQGMSQQKAQEQYGSLQQRGQLIGQQLQQEEQQLQMQGQTEMDSLVKKVRVQIRNYGEDNGYDFILGGGEGGGVLYGKEAKDVTDEIVEILNENYKDQED